MSKNKLFATISMLPLLGLLVAAALPRDLTWRSSDHEKIGKEIASYFDAKDERKGIAQSWEKLTKAVERLEKKFKDQDILSFVEDWEAALLVSALEALDTGKIKKGKIIEDKAEVPGLTVELAIHFPKKYKSAQGPLPLVLLLPDEGKKPKEHIDEFWIEAAGREGAILAALEMPADIEVWDELRIDGPSGIGSIMISFGNIRNRYPVDMDRVFLAGSGKAIGAALAAAAAFPHNFAGVIGRGAAPEFSATNFRNVPTLFVAGGTHATTFESDAKEAGYENVTLLPGGSEADIWTWLLAHSRDAYPTELTFQPYALQGKVCNWLQVDGFELGKADALPLVHAKVDKAANQITVTAERVSTVTIYFNDLLVDLGEPVKVVINGTTYEQHLSRGRRDMLDRCYGWGDWGRIFPADSSFDVPVVEEEDK